MERRRRTQFRGKLTLPDLRQQRQRHVQLFQGHNPAQHVVLSTIDRRKASRPDRFKNREPPFDRQSTQHQRQQRSHGRQFLARLFRHGISSARVRDCLVN